MQARLILHLAKFVFVVCRPIVIFCVVLELYKQVWNCTVGPKELDDYVSFRIGIQFTYFVQAIVHLVFSN